MRRSTIREPGLGIDAVEFGRGDQGYITAARSPPRSEPANSHARPRERCRRTALSGIVRRADAAVVEKAGEGRPALEHVIHRLGDIGVPRQPGAFGEHPSFELADKRPDPILADREPLLGHSAVDLTLDREDLVDPADRFDSERRFAKIGQDEEFAPTVAPAGRLGDRAGSAPAS